MNKFIIKARVKAVDDYRRGLFSRAEDLIDECHFKFDSCPLSITENSNKEEQIWENFYPNQLYGIASSIRHHYSIETNPLPVIFGHGVHDAYPVWSLETKSPFPIACYSDYSLLSHLQACSYLGIKKRNFLHSHPYRLICEHRKNLDLELSENQCIYFPDHSSSRVKVHHLDQLNIKEMVECAREHFEKVNLCIYYIDYHDLCGKGIWANYRSNFDDVYCIGHRSSQKFLPRLHACLSIHGSVIVDILGSVAYLAEIQEIPVFMYSPKTGAKKSMAFAVGMSNDEYIERIKIDEIIAKEREWSQLGPGLREITLRTNLSRMVNSTSQGKWFLEILKSLFDGKDVMLDPKYYRKIHRIIYPTPNDLSFDFR